MTAPYVPKDAHLSYDWVDILWCGYGLDISDIERKERFYENGGGTTGYQARLSYNPQTRITIVNLSVSPGDPENGSAERENLFRFVNRLRDLL